MRRLFLSASIPQPGRGDYHLTANPFLIQFAVRELLTVCLGRRMLVWGGHPAITPMVWAVCEGLGIEYAKAVTLYQSKQFSDYFPVENAQFGNMVLVNAVDGDSEKSLHVMRTEMLSGPFEAAVFIGGMDGVIAESAMFQKMHPTAKMLALRSPGGAALTLADQLGQVGDRIDFARLFHEELGIASTEKRDQIS
ncbi:SLOG domain-containing protein [Duganella sp. S19_KUP01_CR8]|uniref:SLOG domain-containing protein n=1 Tax=Duganella sp. S19_KUP01_CR8 TaxID=3025502 RepID=UPI002FCD7480